MQLHINAIPSFMTQKTNPLSEQAWAKLIRIQQTILNQIELDLKKAGFPPLAWYDVLLELSRETHGQLKLKTLESRLLLPQYNLSRLLDRLLKADLIQRKSDPGDQRAKIITLSAKGSEMQKDIWLSYGPSLQKNIGMKLSDTETMTLISLLHKLE